MLRFTHTHTPSSTRPHGLSCFLYFIPTPLLTVVPTSEFSFYKEYSSFNGGPLRCWALTFIHEHSNNNTSHLGRSFICILSLEPFLPVEVGQPYLQHRENLTAPQTSQWLSIASPASQSNQQSTWETQLGLFSPKIPLHHLVCLYFLLY